MDKQLLYQQLFQAKGNCLTEEQLLSYVQGTLSEKEQHHVEKHLLSCDLCDEAVDGLLLIQKERQNSLISSTKQAISKRITKVNYWAWAAIFSGIFISTFTVFYLNNQLSKNYQNESMTYDMSPTMKTESIEDVYTEKEVEETQENTPTPIKETQQVILEEKKTKKEKQHKDLSISAPIDELKNELTLSPEPTLTQEPNNNETLVENMVLNDFSKIEEETKENAQGMTNSDFYDKDDDDINKKRKANFKIAENKNTSLGMNISDEMRNIAFSKIPKDTSKAFILFSAQNYQMASILYQDELKKEPQNEWLVYTNSLLYLLLKEEENAINLLKEIKNSDKEQWLLACVFIKNEETKKAKKLLKKLAKNSSLFSKDAQNILDKIN